MAINTNILKSSEFKWVLDFDPNKSSVDLTRAAEYGTAINKVAQGVIALIPGMRSHEDQKLVQTFTQKLGSLNEYFNKQNSTSLFDQSVENLALTSSAFETSFSPSVQSLLKSDSLNLLLRGNGDVGKVLKELNRLLQTENLSKEDLAILKKVTQKCYEVANAGTISSETKGLIDQAVSSIKDHIFIQSPLFQNLKAYNKGSLKGRNPEFVANELETFASQLALLVKSGNVSLSSKDLLAIHDNMKIIQSEFLGKKEIFQPALSLMQNIPAVKEGIFKRFQEGIKNLSLDSPNLGKNIEQLKGELKGLFSSHSSEYIKIAAYLDELKTSRLFAPTSGEMSLVERIQSKNKKLKDGNYLASSSTSVRTAQEKFLNVMKQNTKDLQTFSNALEKTAPSLVQEARKSRFEKFLTEHDVKFTKLGERFPLLLDAFEDVSLIAKSGFQQKWKQIKQQYDKITNGKFSQIVEKVSYANMGTDNFNDMLSVVQDSFFSKCNMAKLDADANFKADLENALQETVSELSDSFKDIYESEFQKGHEWIARNVSYIDVAYDQSLDVHKNSADGTCFENSLARQVDLLSNPIISTKDFHLGSTDKARFHSAKAKMTRRFVSVKAAVEEQLEGVKSFGLVEKSHKALSGKGITEAIQDMVKWSKDSKETQMIFSMTDPSHALNVQIDEARKTFRFFDDNGFYTGSFPDLNTFGVEFTKYLKAFYPDATGFKVRTYKTLPKEVGKPTP